jgi:pyrroline-5-carboxylate reductase
VTASTTYGVLGVGSIARAIVVGLCDGIPDPPRIVLSPRGAAVSAELAGRFPSVSVAANNQAVVDGSDVLLVCLRKADAAPLGELTWRPEHVVVSAAAGVGVAQLTEWVAPATRVCRSVPMPPVADRAGLTAVHPPLAEARTLFDRLGSTLEVPDVVAYEALSATSATLAGFFEYLRTQTEWLETRGIPADDARRYVAATFAGALTSLRAVAAPDFAELAADYATPGGVNEQVARELREHGTFDVLAQALDRALGRLAT